MLYKSVDFCDRCVTIRLCSRECSYHLHINLHRASGCIVSGTFHKSMKSYDDCQLQCAAAQKGDTVSGIQ